jgi:hypothetical protein
MSVDETATSDQQKLALGAGSDARKHELPVETGKLVGASEHPAYQTEPAEAQSQSHNATAMPALNVDAILRGEGSVGVTDADWHSSHVTPIPAPKTKDELIEHLSEALAEMASDYTEMPTNPDNTPSGLEAAQSGHQIPPPQASFGQSAPPQLAAPLHLHQHIGPSQQIRSSLPPGSVPSQTNPQMPAIQPAPAESQLNRPNENQAGTPRNVISDQLSQAAAAAQQSQIDQRAQPTQQPAAPAPSHWGPPPGVGQTSAPEPIKASNVATGDHATVQRPTPPPQHYFVLEDLAPPATPPHVAPDQGARDKSSSGAKSPEHQTPTDLDAAIIDASNLAPERRTQFEVTSPILLEPKDGLQIRRLIATQQGIPAAIPIAGSEQEPALPAERTFRPPIRPEPEQASPNVLTPQAHETQKDVGT